jgi:hypothetical protein
MKWPMGMLGNQTHHNQMSHLNRQNFQLHGNLKRQALQELDYPRIFKPHQVSAM